MIKPKRILDPVWATLSARLPAGRNSHGGAGVRRPPAAMHTSPPPAPASPSPKAEAPPGLAAPAITPPACNAVEEDALYHEFAELSRKTLKRPLVVFFGRATFADNTKYLFLHAARTLRDHDVVWCTWSKPLAAQLAARGLKCFDLGADAGATFKFLLHAAVAVFCENPAAALNLNSHLCGCLAGAQKIQLWHGVSVKQLDLMLIHHLDVRDGLFRRQLRYATRVDHFLSTSSCLDSFWLRAFGCTSLIRAGQPRNEVLVRPPADAELLGAELPPHQAELLHSRRPKLLLTPTWQRGQPLCISTAPFFQRLSKWAAANHGVVFVKLHPFFQRVGLPETLDGRVFFLNAGVDVYPWMAKFDALITDYSSIMFDFLLTGKPVFTFDARTQVAWGFEPDYSLIPEGEFRYEFNADDFEAVLNKNLADHPLAAAQRTLAGKLFETPPADACAQLLQVIQEVSRATVDKDYTVLSPALPAQLARIAV
jgi:CDP-glycerol glycerophosphotransferase (TagB/SpsB family)